MEQNRDPRNRLKYVSINLQKMRKSIQWEKDIPCKWKSKESWSSNFISDKIDFKIKTITRDKEGQPLH